MARGTVTDKILEAIGFFVSFYAELAKRCDMMDIKLPFQGRFAYSTRLADILVSMSGIAALLKPVGAIVRFRSAFPLAAILARKVPRGALPCCSASYRAEKTPILADYVGSANDLLSTHGTQHSYATILRMLLSSWVIETSPCGTTFPIAEMVFELRYVAALYLYGATTCSAMYSYAAILGMFVSPWIIEVSPCGTTLPITEMMFESCYILGAHLYRFTAMVA